MADSALAPAGFWARYAAWTLDATIVGIPVLLLCIHGIMAAMDALDVARQQLGALTDARLADTLSATGDPLQLATQLLRDPQLLAATGVVDAALHALLLPPLLLFAAVAALYWTGFERSPWQATPGKRALGLRVVDAQGHRLAWPRAVLRHFAGALSWLSLNLGHALAAWTHDKRALHDFIAGTRVVRAASGRALPGWAKSWIGLQLLALLVVNGWLLARGVEALRTALGLDLG